MLKNFKHFLQNGYKTPCSLPLPLSSLHGLAQSYRKYFSELNMAQINTNLSQQIHQTQSSDPDLMRNIPEVPWFPSYLNELDEMGNVMMHIDEEEAKDHPSFADPVYRQRRIDIGKSSLDYKMGTPIPYLKYKPEENKTWEYIFKTLRPLQEKYMCDSFNKSFEKMVDTGIVKPNEIPQLQDLNEYLIKETNFRLKPVPGILSQREFLNALGLRVFCCTQFIRHHTMPEYTPEPDIIHELLGHVATFSDPDFCDLSQQIGLQSCGTSEENIKKLGAVFWYTVEFGVCKQDNGLKVYGAGIGASIKEIKYFGEGKMELRPFNPFEELNLDLQLQNLQPRYYVTESFKDACDILTSYGNQLHRPFKASFNKQKHMIETDRKVKLIKVEEAPVIF